jgi:DNA-binding transcriptional MerR regulator
MIKIGDFSKLSMVSIKTLRYYDEIGLLKPAKVDQFTDYRYYSTDQLPRLNRINMFKDIGFTLDEILRLLDQNLSSENIKELLEQKRVEIKSQVDQVQQQLNKIDSYLIQINKEGTMPDYQIQIKKVLPQKVVCLREVIPDYSKEGPLWEKFCGIIGKNMTRVSGAPITIYNEYEYKEKNVDIEVSLPIKSEFAVKKPITIRELPGEDQVAYVIHKGKYEELSKAYNALMTWIEKNGYEIANFSRQIYLRGSGEEKNPDNFITEVQLPIRKNLKKGF